MTSTERLRERHPLGGLSPSERVGLHRATGMHSPNEAMRTDNDTFEVRNDVSVEDACITSLRLVRMAVAQLEMLGSSADLAHAHREVVDGIACLGRLACGSLWVVDFALRDELSTNFHGA